LAGTLVVAIVGGWLYSRVGDDGVDANLTTPGVVQDPTLGTNAPVQGKKFPSLNVTALTDGSEVDVESKGTPLVVNYWYSTCTACRREMPTLAAASRTYPTVSFIGINPVDRPKDAQEFVDMYSVDYPIYLDRNGEALKKSGVGTFPVTLFVDANGVIVKQHAGEITAAEIADYISEYFGITA
jgi:thiol-disulfide isomerase/thioredoxin